MHPGRRHHGLYFRSMVIPDEALSSSEDGSIPSPQSTFFFHQPPHMPQVESGRSARYHVNPRVNSPSDTEIHAPQFDFAQGLNQDLQPPRPDQQLVPPSSSAEWLPEVTFPQAHCDQPHRCQRTEHIFSTQQQPVQLHAPAATVTSPLNFRYLPPPTEQPSSGEPSHDQVLNQIPAASTGPNVHVDPRPHTVDVAERTEPSMAIVPTTSRPKGISHVVIACRLCRARKIRCDSLRPCCTNCSRRSNTCEYDPSPKRRGPDKYPGTRQRRSKKRPNDGTISPPPKRRRTAVTGSRRVSRAPPLPSPNQTQMSGSSAGSPSSYYPESPTDFQVQQTSPISPSPTLNRVEQQPSSSLKQESPIYHRQTDYTAYTQEFQARDPYSHSSTSIQSVPYNRFLAPVSPIAPSAQTTLWDRILAGYSPQHLIDQFHFLASNATHQLCFINRDFLGSRLQNEVDRRQIQPAFILAGLALAQLLRSSSAEGGENGMAQAMGLRDQAQSALEEATVTDPFHPDLAKAVYLLAVFESSAYKEYSYDRYCAALLRLNNVMQSMALPTNDGKNPTVSKFAANAPPVINQVDGPPIGRRKCKCCPAEVTDPPKVVNRTYELPWKPDWTPKQIGNEEIRRLCWCALGLMSEHTTQGIAFGRDPGGFYLTTPGNFSLLFPGETWDQLSERRHPDDPLSTKESVWGLYCRSMLIWNFCVGLFYDRVQVDDRMETVSQSVQEVDVLSGLLDVHTCNLDTSIIYITREYLFNTRLLLAQELRSGIVGLPRSNRGLLYNTSQVQKWVAYQVEVVTQIRASIGNYNTQEGQAAFRRPFIVSWFVNQLHLCLTLWPYEQTMVGLLSLGKDLIYIVDTLNVLWDCPANRTLTETLRRELITACQTRAIPPPML